MDKGRLFKILYGVGFLCIAIGLFVRFVLDMHGEQPEFFIGTLVGAGIALIIGIYIRRRRARSA